eukprot:GHRQ01037242.1.p1 GENE.GHRQ01037242.1~~GHRQ01037242.1.p1  ORF type:complete len:110 (-),score=19.77 GHRQ01037242.1:783-1112(-)
MCIVVNHSARILPHLAAMTQQLPLTAAGPCAGQPAERLQRLCGCLVLLEARRAPVVGQGACGHHGLSHRSKHALQLRCVGLLQRDGRCQRLPAQARAARNRSGEAALEW